MDSLLRSKISDAVKSSIPEPGLMSIDVNKLSAYAGQMVGGGMEQSIYDGEKFFGGYGTTQVLDIDYWTLRARSAELYNTNLYARGIIRRLVTNEINTGLTPEAIPDENILGLKDSDLVDWTEERENRFGLWANDANLCDYKQRNTFGALQRIARMEAFVTGDVLVVMRQSRATKLPMIQLVSGNRVQTPFASDTGHIPKNHVIRHGVQFDKRDRIVGYWIKQDDASFKFMPARGSKSGRKLAWLVFGSDKRLDDVRGQPLLSLILQSLKGIDQYRDSTQRKALINSFFAASIEKDKDKMGTLPIQGAAVRNDTATASDSDGSTRTFNVSKYIPGIVLDELQVGESLNLHSGQGTDLNFPTFETAIVSAMAWCYEIPPEILTLAFSSNYSASTAAINEFNMYIHRVWTEWGETFCTPIYIDHFISEALIGKNERAQSILESWRNNSRYDIFAAWTAVEWYGSIKPSVDMVKQMKGSESAIRLGLSTHAREARVTTGTKFSKNIKRLTKEWEQLATAMRPILELKAEFGDDVVSKMLETTSGVEAGNETDDKAVND